MEVKTRRDAAIDVLRKYHVSGHLQAGWFAALSNIFRTTNYLIDETPNHKIAFEVLDELLSAQRKFGQFHSMHEGASVIREEYKEFETEVFQNNYLKARMEAIQLAAMAIRFVVDLGGLENRTNLR